MLNKSKSVKGLVAIDKTYEKLVKDASYDEVNWMLPKFQNNIHEQNEREVLIFELRVHRLQKELDELTFKKYES